MPLQGSAGFEVIHRFGLRRAVRLDDPPLPPRLPPGWRFAPAREVALEPLNLLDWEAFRGSPDAAFIADEPGGEPSAHRGDRGRAARAVPGGGLGRGRRRQRGAGRLHPHRRGVPSRRGDRRRGRRPRPAADRPGTRAPPADRYRALLALGHTEARLWVTDSDRPARALYESLGFDPEATALIYRWRRRTRVPRGSARRRPRGRGTPRTSTRAAGSAEGSRRCSATRRASRRASSRCSTPPHRRTEPGRPGIDLPTG